MSSENMPMKEGMKGGMMAGATVRTGTGSGVVNAIDEEAGPLTMPLKADPPALLDTVKAEDRASST